MMKNLRTFAIAMIAAVGAYSFSAAAANENNTEGTDQATGLKWRYYNDVKDDGTYWSNWIVTPPAGKTMKDYAPTQTDATYTYVLTKDGSNFMAGEGTRGGYGDNEIQNYLNLGILGEGSYVMKTHAKFVNGATVVEFDFGDVTWTVGKRFMLTLNVTNPQTLGETSASVDYELTVKNAEDVDHYHIYCVYPGGNGDVTCGQIDTKDLKGTLTLTGLPERATTNIWVKCYAVMKDNTNSAEITFPGEAQGWTGLSVNTALTPGEIIPTAELSCSNAVAKTLTTGSVDYTISSDNDNNVKEWTLLAVTNGEKELGRLITTDKTGSLDLSGLNSGTLTEIWVKVSATLNSGATTDVLAQYPGAAQNWTGLSIDTTGAPADPEDAISEIAADNNQSVEYFTLQGVRVSNPSAGVFMVRRGTDVSKVIIR